MAGAVVRLELVQRLGDRPVAAEEQRGVLVVEGAQPFERRAFQRQRPHRVLGQPAVELDVTQQELFQVLLEQRHEFIDRLVRRKRSADRLVRVEKEALAEGVELLALARIVARRPLAHPAVDQDVGLRLAVLLFGAFFEGVGRLLQLPLGTGVEAGAVLAVELRRQRRAEPRPEDADEEIAVGGADQLLVEMCRRPQRLLFPEYRLQPDEVPIARLQPLHDPPDRLTFVANVAG